MTNAEKYLKDGVDLEELANELEEYGKHTENRELYSMDIKEFFKQKTKQLLSEDEKFILKNVNTKQYSMIGRKLGGALYLGDVNFVIDSSFDDFFENVFDWIEEGEEYKISDLLGDE